MSKKTKGTTIHLAMVPFLLTPLLLMLVEGNVYLITTVTLHAAFMGLARI